MTQHPAELSRLPKELSDMLPLDQRDQERLMKPPPGAWVSLHALSWNQREP